MQALSVAADACKELSIERRGKFVPIAINPRIVHENIIFDKSEKEKNIQNL